MKRKKENSLALGPVRTDKTVGPLPGALVFCALFMAGWGRGLALSFASCSLPWAGIMALSVALAFLFCLLLARFSPELLLLGACLLALLAGALLLQTTRASLAGLANDILDFYTLKRGSITMSFSRSGSGDLAALLLTLPVAAAAAAAGRRLRRLPLLPVCLLLALAAAFGLLKDLPALVLLLSGLLLLYLLWGQGKTPKASRALPLLLASLLLGFGLLAAFGLGENPSFAADTRESLTLKLHQLRWHSQEYAMPEGQLSDLPARSRGGQPALQVTMEQWQKTYFRGFTAESYQGDCWLPTEAENRALYEDSFYWLHKQGCYGQTLAGSASALVSGEPSAAFTTQSLTACRGCSYLPTGLLSGEALDAAAIGDDGSRAGGSASGSYQPGGLDQWFTARQALAAGQNREEIREFLQLEQAYRSYVYDTCLSIPNAAGAAIQALEGSERESLTLSEIKGRILSLLDENLTYDEAAVTLNGRNDFVTYLLQQSHSGYSVHYATLATLLFRWYGVPARYVEGYFVPAEEAARYEDGDTVVLYEASAHAWTEYYLDGVGWIPFETTPPYRDDEEAAAGQSLSQAYQTYENNVTYTPPYQQEERTDTSHWREQANPAWLLLLLPLLLLLLLLRVLLRRHRLKKGLAAMAALAHGPGIQQEYAYACFLEKLAGLDPGEGEEAARAAEINQLARFSGREPSDDQRRLIQNHLALVLQDCKKRWKLFRRIYYRYWKCLYW